MKAALVFLCLQPNSSRLGNDVFVIILNLKEQSFRSIGAHTMKVLKILDIVAKLHVGCSHKDVEQMLHEHWRHSIKSFNPVVEEMQDIVQNKYAFHYVLSFKIAEAHDKETTVNVVGQVLRCGHDAFCNEIECVWSRKRILREIFA